MKTFLALFPGGAYASSHLYRHVWSASNRFITTNFVHASLDSYLKTLASIGTPAQPPVGSYLYGLLHWQCPRCRRSSFTWKPCWYAIGRGVCIFSPPSTCLCASDRIQPTHSVDASPGKGPCNALTMGTPTPPPIVSYWRTLIVPFSRGTPATSTLHRQVYAAFDRLQPTHFADASSTMGTLTPPPIV